MPGRKALRADIIAGMEHNMEGQGMFNYRFDEIEKQTTGIIFNIEHFHVHDGEGIRTNVFLKGCSLHCPWCCNPESICPAPQIAQYQKLCTGCGKCAEACPERCCIRKEDGYVITDFSKCSVCGKCVSVCPAGARELFGKRMSVSEVIAEVEKDSAYFLNSDGGLTLSGGEACLQPEFARELIRAAHRRYIPAALETAGAVEWERLWKAAEEADEILMDLKTTVSMQFEKIGRFSLETVTTNLRMLAEAGKNITLRCPIIPDFNDHEGHIQKIAETAGNVGVKKIDLLPFHQLGRHKYAAIGRNYRMADYPEIKDTDVKKMAETLRKQGFQVSIGG